MRHIDVDLTYRGKNITESIKNDLTNFSYDEKAAGSSDSLSLTLSNKSLKWFNGWFPETGDQIHGKILTYGWSKPGEINSIDCGSMVVDEPEFTGPPNVFTLKALSVPAAAGFSDTPADHTWTKISMKQLGQSIASKYGLSFLYDAPDFVISSLKQSNQADSEFLAETASKFNLSVKVFSNRLVIFSKVTYEKRKPIAVYTLGKSNISSYEFYAPTVGTGYSAVVENYKPPNSKRQLSYSYRAPGTSGGKTLTINESADNLAQAEMIAKAKLRESNEQGFHGTLTVALDLRLAAACVIQITGFGKMSGNYFIDSSTHSGGDQAGQTEIEIHKCLEGGY